MQRSSGMAPDLRALLACAKSSIDHSDFLEALKPQMEQWEANPQFATKTLSELGRMKRFELVERVLECMHLSTLETNVYHYTAVIAAGSKSDSWGGLHSFPVKHAGGRQHTAQ